MNTQTRQAVAVNCSCPRQPHWQRRERPSAAAHCRLPPRFRPTWWQHCASHRSGRLQAQGAETPSTVAGRHRVGWKGLQQSNSAAADSDADAQSLPRHSSTLPPASADVSTPLSDTSNQQGGCAATTSCQHTQPPLFAGPACRITNSFDPSTPPLLSPETPIAILCFLC